MEDILKSDIKSVHAHTHMHTHIHAHVQSGMTLKLKKPCVIFFISSISDILLFLTKALMWSILFFKLAFQSYSYFLAYQWQLQHSEIFKAWPFQHIKTSGSRNLNFQFAFLFNSHFILPVIFPLKETAQTLFLSSIFS